MTLRFMRFSACIIMHVFAYISLEDEFYACFMQDRWILLPFLSKNFGRDFQISPKRDEISL